MLKPLLEDFIAYRDLYLAHKLIVREAAELCGMAKSSFADAVKRSVNEDQTENQENKSVNKEINAPRKNKKSKEKAKVTPAPSKPKKIDKKSCRKNRRTGARLDKIFTLLNPKCRICHLLEQKRNENQYRKVVKSTENAKKPAENKQISVRQRITIRTIFH